MLMDIEKLFLSNRDTDSHRVCGTCGELKPVSEFYRDGVDKDGSIKYRRDCKDCYKVTRIKNARRKENG